MTPSSTGSIDFKVGDEIFQTWYRVFGDLSSSHRPLVVLHGGPGIPSFYLEPFSDLTSTHGIPVIIYDQIGCGNSSRLRNKDASFFSEKLFIDELENLLNYFGISNNYDILGHSWGGMIASRFAGTRHPRGLKHLILANSLARMSDWTESNLQHLRHLPERVQRIITFHESAGTTDSKEYHNALAHFFDRCICLIRPHPASMAQSERALEEDNTVLRKM